jgi:hypothetical protein
MSAGNEHSFRDGDAVALDFRSAPPARFHGERDRTWGQLQASLRVAEALRPLAPFCCAKLRCRRLTPTGDGLACSGMPSGSLCGVRSRQYAVAAAIARKAKMKPCPNILNSLSPLDTYSVNL